MIIAIPTETFPGERRVALTPDSVQRLVARTLQVRLQSGAGVGAWFSDDDYRCAGACVETSVERLLGEADVIAKIRAPSISEVEQFRRGATLICLFYPRMHAVETRCLASRGITTFALENLPRTTIAQAMDVLSSQSTAAGYRAVIVAAHSLAKFFPMLMTPAGTIAPARVLVLGAGVAGLQAIATARRLGAVVEAFDVRRGTRADVESLGAKFIEPWLSHAVETAQGYASQLDEPALERARRAICQPLANADVCITTALVPNQRAPILITNEMVKSMRAGSVIVDLAVDQGGNCKLTQAGQETVCHGVAIIGRLNLASEAAIDASRMYSRNLEKVIGHFLKDGNLRFDFDDEIARRCVVTHDNEIVGAELRQTIAPPTGG
jgi:proton-translocating NAD(P)+ transhydrogenase subunit alpha